VAVTAILTACQLDGLRLVEVKGVTSTHDTHMYGKNSSWTRNMRTFGEAGVVAEGKNKKFASRGTTMMFVRYPSNREHDCVKMYNPDTNRIVTTRDVIWLNQFYYKRQDDDLILWTENSSTDEVKNVDTDTVVSEVVEAEDEVEGTADSDESESEEEIDTSGNALAQSVRCADELEQETAARGNESDHYGAAAPTQSLMRSNFGVAPSRLIEEMNST
jgi:hypothetical protein